MQVINMREFNNSWLIDPIEKQLYKDFLKQEKFFRQINFKEKTNILIITDRNFGWSKGLHTLFEKSDANIDVKLIFNHQEEYGFMADILIISGYLKDKDNYKILDRVKSENKNVIIIMYANLDGLIRELCARYGINYIYERQGNSVYDFLDYINELVMTAYKPRF